MILADDVTTTEEQFLEFFVEGGTYGLGVIGNSTGGATYQVGWSDELEHAAHLVEPTVPTADALDLTVLQIPAGTITLILQSGLTDFSATLTRIPA